MIEVLYNFISIITLIAGYILGDLILISISPIGFVAVVFLIIFIGRLMILDILEDIKTASHVIYLRYQRHHLCSTGANKIISKGRICANAE